MAKSTNDELFQRARQLRITLIDKHSKIAARLGLLPPTETDGNRGP